MATTAGFCSADSNQPTSRLQRRPATSRTSTASPPSRKSLVDRQNHQPLRPFNNLQSTDQPSSTTLTTPYVTHIHTIARRSLSTDSTSTPASFLSSLIYKNQSHDITTTSSNAAVRQFKNPPSNRILQETH